jgi:hypothetical protein
MILLGQREQAPLPRPVNPKDFDQTAFTGTWEVAGCEFGSIVLSKKQIEELNHTDKLTIDAKAGTFKRKFDAPFAGGSDDKGKFEIVKIVPEGIRVTSSFTREGIAGERRVPETKMITYDLWELVGKDRLETVSIPVL